MNRIEEMIKEMCPDGVKWVKLGEVCEVINGRAYRQSELLSEGKYRVLRVGNFFSNENWYYSNLELEDKYYCQKGDLLYAWSATFGPHLWKEDKTIYHYHIWKLDVSCCVNKKYLYYWLQSNNMLVQVSSEKHGATMAHLTKGLMENLQIPLPPLPIQQEIVKILDSFTALQQNLEDELKLRQKQYEHYREKLLTFEDGECEWKKIKEIFDTRNGYTPSTKNNEFWNGGNIPWFKMEDIRDNGRILCDSSNHITESAIKGKGLFKANSIIIATSATIGEHALITVPHLSNQRFTNLYPKSAYINKINMKFIYYYMFKIDEWCKSHINQGGFASVDMEGFYRLEFPLPSLEKQSKITQTLDHFESLISNLKTEIELRKKQYEYYREKLLTF